MSDILGFAPTCWTGSQGQVYQNKKLCFGDRTNFGIGARKRCRGHLLNPLMAISSSPHITKDTVGSTERLNNLPWTESISKKDHGLHFMPFILHQLEVMKESYPDMKEVPFEKELSYQESTKRPARVESWCFENQDFRKIRMTYIDAGVNAQVFNSVWYPREVYDAPLLGIDFLAFGPKKILCVLDFQPLKQDKEYLEKYCEPIAYIKAKYEGIAGSMSSRFYDENRFFSKQLAFAKFDNVEPIQTQLLPAFKEYLDEYVKMVKSAKPVENNRESIRKLQMEYDQYSAERDPAVGLFTTYWGQEWAEKFTYEFLFSDAQPPTTGDPAQEKPKSD